MPMTCSSPAPVLHSFLPIAADDAEVLILGSMPGAASLAAGQYYAHRQNAFWKIIGTLLDFAPDAPYQARLTALKTARIALWDVLYSCEREGSLDTRIARASEVPNDFAGFFTRHTKISRVYFNGSKAESAFRRHVMPNIDARRLHFCRLPSTSPAHATYRLSEKLTAWQVVTNSLSLQDNPP